MTQLLNSEQHEVLNTDYKKDHAKKPDNSMEEQFLQQATILLEHTKEFFDFTIRR